MPAVHQDSSSPAVTDPALSARAALGLILFLAQGIWLPVGEPMLRGVDAAVYCRVAQEMLQRPLADWAMVTLEGRPFYEHPPGFIYLLACCFALFGGTTQTALAVAHALMSLLVALCAGIGYLAAGPYGAIGTLVAVLAQSGFWMEAHNPMLELPTCVGLATGLWGLLYGHRARSPGSHALGWAAAAAGPAFALACKGPVGLLSLALAGAAAGAGLCSWRRAAAATGASLLCTCIMAAAFETARARAGLEPFLVRYWAGQLWPSMTAGRHHPVPSFFYYGPMLWRWYGAGLCLIPAAVWAARQGREASPRGKQLLALSATWMVCVVLGFSCMRQKYQWYMHTALPGFALLGGATLALCAPGLRRALTRGAMRLGWAATVVLMGLRGCAPELLAPRNPACLTDLYQTQPRAADHADGLHISSCCGTQVGWRERYVALFVHGTAVFHCEPDSPHHGDAEVTP